MGVGEQAAPTKGAATISIIVQPALAIASQTSSSRSTTSLSGLSFLLAPMALKMLGVEDKCELRSAAQEVSS